MHGFSTGIQQIIQTSKSLRNSGQHDWLVESIILLFVVSDTRATRWRHLEAALAAIGSQAEPVLNCIQDEQDSGREKPLDIENLLVDIIPSILGLPGEYFRHCYYQVSLTILEYPFLQGRGFVFASQFAQHLPLPSTGQYLEATINIIESSETSIPVKMSALKAIHK